MNHFYLCTASKATRVGGSVVGKFLPGQDTLIVWKSNRLEVFTLSEDGLVAVTECKLYGQIELAILFRAPGEVKDRLFVLTREHQILTLNVSENHVIEEVATGAIADAAGERARALAVIGEKMAALILNEGMLKVIPIDSKGLFQDAFNVRLPDRDVLALTLLAGTNTIVYLCCDGSDRRLLRSHTVSIKEKSLSEGPIADVMDKGASHLDSLGKGVLVGGELEVVWISGKTRVSAKFPSSERSRLLAMGRLDADGSRWLLSDESGHLWLLACTLAQGMVTRMQLQDMGCTVGANSISYLDNGVVFLGSAMGDSQIVRLLTDPDAESGNFFEILEVQANLAPILDFACVDLEGQGQDQVVACCGALREGTLRIVRNGIGVNMEAELPLPNITGVWSMRASSAAEFDKYLCVSFASQTVFLAMEDDEDLAELQECGGLVSDSRTLFCGTTVGDQIVQVHAGGVRLVKASSLALSDQWQPPEGRQITVCCVNTLPRGQIAVAVGGTLLVCLRVDGMSLRQTASCTLRHEIACMDMTPLVPGEDSTVLAVGFWSEYSVSVLELPSLKTLVSEPLMAGNVVPRSVRLANLDGQPRVLVGLGDGRLVHYRLQGTHELVERKTVPLGTKAVLLTPFVSAGGAASIFVGCDRPAVIYSGARKLLTSNVNQKNVSFVTSFHTAQFPHCLAMATGEALVVGRLQSLQKLHVDTIRLGGEMARRLAHHAPARAFAIGTTSGNVMGRDPSPVQSQLRLLDQVTMERLDSFPLERGEQLCSLASVSLGPSGEAMLVAGTAFVNVGDPEPNQGRILVFQAQRNKDDQHDVKMRLFCSRTVNGAVYALAPYTNGRLVATVNARIELLELGTVEGADGPALVCVAEHFGHVLALHVRTRGDFILVGDLMRSMCLLRFDSVSRKLVLAARDNSSHWLMSVSPLDENFVGCDQDGNIAILGRPDDDDGHLRPLARFHLGEGINALRRGRLVQPDPSLAPENVPPAPLLLGGTSGLLAVLQPIPESDYAFFKKLEDALAAPLVWGLSHSEWRACRFGNRRVMRKHENVLDGDLIESFLDLHAAEQAKIASVVNVPVLELVQRIETIARQIH